MEFQRLMRVWAREDTNENTTINRLKLNEMNDRHYENKLLK
jgi:hypothetical protein